MSGVAEYHLCSILYIGGSMLINVVKNIIISLSNVMIINKGLLIDFRSYAGKTLRQ